MLHMNILIIQGWHKPWLEPHAHEHCEWVDVEDFSMSGDDDDILS